MAHRVNVNGQGDLVKSRDILSGCRDEVGVQLGLPTKDVRFLSQSVEGGNLLLDAYETEVGSLDDVGRVDGF